MAQLYCSGAVNIWVGVGPANQRQAEDAHVSAFEIPPRPALPPTGVQFLGTTERGPRIEILPKFRPIKSDEAGDGAAEVLYMGEEALIFCDVNRWNEDIYAAVASRPVYYQRRGITARRDIGSMMVRNRLTFGLYMHFPYWVFDTQGGFAQRQGVPNAQGGFGVFRFQQADVKKMPAGYYFPYAYLLGPDKFDPLGTRARKIQLVFHALRIQRTLRNRTGPTMLDPAPLYYTSDGYFSALPPIN